MTDRENDALRATNIDQAAEIGILRTEKHADAEAIGSQAAEIERLRGTIHEMLSVMDELLMSPMGVVPRCADPFYNASVGLFARAALAQEAQTNETAATDTEVT